MRFPVFALAFALAALAPVSAFAQAAAPAGTIGLLNGQAQATGLNTPAHALAKGDPVYGGDIVETRASSYTMIRFTDQGSVLLRPNSKFQVEKYQYGAAAPAPIPTPAAAAAPGAPVPVAPLQAATAATQPDSTFFRLLKGGLRAVSGLVAHADYSHYLMSTPVATMGIRGTDYEIAMCEDACLTDPTVLNSIPPNKTVAGSVVSGVNEGQIVVTSFTGNSITLGPGQYAITLADGTQYLLNGIPAFLNSSAAAGGTGVAAGGATAASAAAGGSLLVAAGGAAAIAAIIGVVIGSSSDNGSGTATSTSTSTTR
ncbi:MAG: hypothetical protein JWR07_4751 [Nevskia sp.]|nr:hypothetical protein [Nevskia sp.]